MANLTPNSFNHKYATIGEYRYHYVEEGNKDGLAVLLVHGYPDLWYGWRHQIRHLAAQGHYRVIAVDLLGYGATSKPRSEDPTQAHPDYSPRSLGSHLVGLMDQLGIEKAVLVGHDWGCGVASRIAWHFPQRVHAMICIGNPLRPITKDFITIDELVKENHMFSYFSYFASPQAVIDIDSSMEDYLAVVFSDESGNTAEDRKYYLENLKQDGFHCPLSYYRAFSLSHNEDLPLVGQRLAVPTLMMVVLEDPLIPPAYVRSVKMDYVDHLEYLDIEHGGHFVMTENPDAVNRGIKAYLDTFFGFREAANEEEEKKEVLEEIRNEQQAIEAIEAF